MVELSPLKVEALATEAEIGNSSPKCGSRGCYMQVKPTPVRRLSFLARTRPMHRYQGIQGRGIDGESRSIIESWRVGAAE